MCPILSIPACLTPLLLMICRTFSVPCFHNVFLENHAVKLA